MDPAIWARVEQVLDAVLTRQPNEWSKELDAHCGDDADLRREVEALLARHSSMEDFLESRPQIVADAMAAPPVRRIGAWSLVRPVGRGGMSQVWLAERADGAFEQQVAVKLLRADLDSPVDLARFRSEQQILA